MGTWFFCISFITSCNYNLCHRTTIIWPGSEFMPFGQGPSWLSHDPSWWKEVSGLGHAIWHLPNFHIFDLDRQLLSAPSDFQKQIALAFWKTACSQIPYWAHFTLKVQNSIYVHFPFLNKQLIGISILKCSQKHVMNLEVKDIIKSLLALRL